MTDISSNLLYYYKFDREDRKNNTIKNHATGSYDATISSPSVISNRNYYIGNSSMDCTYGGMNVQLTLGAAGFSICFWLSATHLQNAFYFNSSFINFSHYNNVLRIYGLIDFSMPANGNSSTWMHIIISWSNTNTVTLYLNGKKNTTNTNATYPTVNNVSFDIYGGSYFFEDFRIYNYAISSQEDINYLLYYPNYKKYTNSLSSASLLSNYSSNFYDRANQNLIFDNEPRNILPGSIVLLSGKPTSKTNNLGNYANSVTYSSISQAIFNSQYSALYVIDSSAGSISIINTQTGFINVLPTMDSASKTVENRYNLNIGIKSLAFDIIQNYYYVTNGSYVQQMNYTTNKYIQNINTDALTSINYCVTDTSNNLYIAYATGINKINLSGTLPTATSNVITTAIAMSKMMTSPIYPNKLFAIDINSGKIYIINTITNAYYALTLPGYVITALCFDTLGQLYVSTTSRIIFLIPSRVFTNYTVDTTLVRTGNYNGAYDWMGYAGTGAIGSTGDGGLGINATFGNISNIIMDYGNNMYICDTSNCTIRKIINKAITTNYLNTITDEMSISSQYDISTLYSPSYSIGVNEPSNYCIGTTSTSIDTNIHGSNYNIIDSSGLILYYRFNSQDVNGTDLANYSKGFPVYDASLSIAGLVNSTDYVLDNAALNLTTGSGNVTINNSILKTGINSTSLFNTNGLSFTCWVKSNNTINNGRVFEIGNSVSASNSIVMCISGNIINPAINKNSIVTNYNTNYSINNNIWHHICWTLTYSTGSTSTHNVYVDGNIIYQTATGEYPNNAVTYPVCYIGKSTYPTDPSFNGIIDDFRFYNRILSQSEVSTLYNKGTYDISFVDLITIGAIPTLTVTNTVYSYSIINDSVPIRNGTYNIVASSTGGSSVRGMYAFDNNNSTFAQSQGTRYTNGIWNNTTTEITTFSDSTVINRDYSQIQLPYMLNMISYKVVNTSSFATISIKSYILAGSTDGTIWDYIDYVDMSSNPVLSFDVSLNTYENSWTWTYRNMGKKYYNYFRFIGNSMSSGYKYQLAELQLYGIGKYIQNVPTTNTFSLTQYDTIPVLTDNTTTISNYTPTILNGTYIASQSSALTTPGSLGYLAFDYNVDNFWQSNAVYNSSGAYTGTVTTTFKNTTSPITISGEWLQIQLPYSISITGYTLLPRSSTQLAQFPKQWYLVGSNDGSNWYTIDYKNAITPTYTYLSYGNGYANKNYYSYFRLIIITSNNTAGTSVVSINQMQLIGTGKPLEQYTNTYELPSYNAVPTMTSASTTISGNMPAILNGTYICSSSANGFSNNYYEYYAFDSNTSTFWNGDYFYNSLGTYIGTNTTTIVNIGSISGEWIQIGLPYSLSLSGYRILPRSGGATQFPKNWYMVGSNNGTTWYAIDNETNISVAANTNIYYNYNISYENNNYYRYFRLIIMSISGTGANSGTTIADIKLQGTGTDI